MYEIFHKNILIVLSLKCYKAFGKTDALTHHDSEVECGDNEVCYILWLNTGKSVLKLDFKKSIVKKESF